MSLYPASYRVCRTAWVDSFQSIARFVNVSEAKQRKRPSDALPTYSSIPKFLSESLMAMRAGVSVEKMSDYILIASPS